MEISNSMASPQPEATPDAGAKHLFFAVVAVQAATREAAIQQVLQSVDLLPQPDALWHVLTEEEFDSLGLDDTGLPSSVSVD